MLFFVIAGLCVIGLGSIIVGDFTTRGLAVAGIPVAIITVVYALYRFPRVELRHKEIALINPMKSVRIPWNLVDGFDIHFGLGVRTHEKIFSSWPLASKGKKMEKDEHGIRRLMDNPNPAVDTVLDRYSKPQRRGAGEPSRRTHHHNFVEFRHHRRARGRHHLGRLRLRRSAQLISC